MSDDEQRPIGVSEDGRSRRSLTVIALGIIGLARALVAMHVFNYDLSSISAEDLINIMLVIGLCGGTVWVGIKGLLVRIKDGLSPKHSDPPLKAPPVVTATLGTISTAAKSVVRLTK